MTQTTIFIILLLFVCLPASAEENSVFVCDAIGFSEPPQCIHGHFESTIDEENAKKIWDESVEAAKENAKLQNAFDWFYQYEAHYE